jgi:cell division protein FtsN
MTYDFSFDKKSATLLAGCGLVFAALLVSAGFLLGVQHANRVPPVNATRQIAAIKLPTTPELKPPSTHVSAIPLAAAQPDPGKSAPAAASNSESASPSVPVAAGAPDSTNAALTPRGPHAVHDRKPKYCLQFGTFQDKANADTKVKSLKEAGITAEVLSTHDFAGRSWFAVRTGSYDGLIAATNAAHAMSDRTGDYVIVRYSGLF